MEGQTAGSNVLNKEIERATEPVVRSRWSPKPEQILILESIFNSGMVNPSKDETVRIRKLLEKFGSVGDANVFYWFQNRRSRSRRRQRQIQASLATDLITSSPIPAYNTINHETTSSASSSCSSCSSCSSNGYLGSISGDGVNYMFPISQQMGLTEIEQLPVVSPNVYHAEVQNLQYQPEFVTVFINGVPTEIPSGSLDMRAMFGQDTLLLNSLGEPVPVNEYGISLQGLQNGENYYLVSRSI